MGIVKAWLYFYYFYSVAINLFIFFSRATIYLLKKESIPLLEPICGEFPDFDILESYGVDISGLKVQPIRSLSFSFILYSSTLNYCLCFHSKFLYSIFLSFVIYLLNLFYFIFGWKVKFWISAFYLAWSYYSIYFFFIVLSLAASL